ncbi:DUF1566 domain-containing protein, partial [Lamprobacter modestohalophilus]|uniref:Lcl domain-containing protein n=1 Tax=Lamprobacter modestohalophilus TaxID=1064514 RepID=UPI002ADEAB6B
MWKRCAEGQTGADCGTGTPMTYTWSGALDVADQALFADYGDWRLPNRKELATIIEQRCVDPPINLNVFPNSSFPSSWSASPDAGNSDYAWGVTFGGGVYRFFKSDNYAVRLVRGGQSFGSFEGGPVPATSATFLSENLPDGTPQIGPATKAWRFRNGETAIQGLTAVRISADAGLGITATELSLGDVAANAEFLVELPIDPVRGLQLKPRSVWKLVDGDGAQVGITNSADDTFWVSVRTNQPPLFSPLQLVSVGGRSGEAMSLPLIGEDADGDALTFSILSGEGAIGAPTSDTTATWTGSPTTAGDGEVQVLRVQVSDGLETATKDISLVVYGTNGLGEFFADVPYPGLTNPADTNSLYAAAHYLAVTGLVIGCGTQEDGQRIFCPDAKVTQAEALGVLMLAVQELGLLSVDEAPFVPANLMVYDAEQGIYQNNSWAAPYAFTAARLGMIGSVYSWDPSAPVTRMEFARWLDALLPMQVPMAVLVAYGTTDLYMFADVASFASEFDYAVARRAAFSGYLGTIGGTFGPDTEMTRAEFAVAASKVLRTPQIDGLQLTGTTLGERFGETMPVITHGETLSITGVENLHVRETHLTG